MTPGLDAILILKRLIQVLAILLLTTKPGISQTTDPVMKKLLEQKLISKKQVKDFKKLLEKQESQSAANYLYALFQTEFKKTSGDYYSEWTTHMSFEKHVPEQNKINRELSDYLVKLKTCSLVTEKQFHEYVNKIEHDEYVHLFQLLPDLYNQSAYDEWLRPEKIIQYGEKLLANDVISDNAFARLREDASTGKIIYVDQLINYCKHARFFDLSKYSNDPDVYLEQIHREVSSMFPELSFTDFNYKIEIDSAESFSDYTAYNVVVSMKVNGTPYRQKSSISPTDIGKDGNYLGKLDTQQFYQIFNKVLADHHSHIRLHQISRRLRLGPNSMHQYFGIVALAEQQLDTFRYSDSYLQPSYEDFGNTLTTDRINSAIQEYQSLGLLNHLNSRQIEQAKEKIMEQKNTSLNDVLACFPDVIYFFDMELGNLEDPYAEFLKIYSKISHYAFNATNVSDDFDIEKKQTVTIKFNFGPKLYEKVFKIEDDWVDPEFFSFINEVVSENKLNGRFHHLYLEGQEASVIYLTEQQYDYLKINDLLRFE